MSDQERLETLYNAILSNEATRDEAKEFFGLASKQENESILRVLMDATYEQVEQIELLKLVQQAKVIPIRRNSWKRVAVAAAIILVVVTAAWVVLFNKKTEHRVVATTTKSNDIPAPGSSRATLKLANGETVHIDSVGNGSIAKQGGVNIAKTSDGEIAYSGSGNEVFYNTLTNPRGSKVLTLTLVDGTKVWLNAESSLIFPTTMNGNERRVEVTGEVYFEVAHNAAKPFVVKNTAKDFEVEVLGTHFNVNTYDDEETSVTLLEGLVKVTKGTGQRMLNPGQQAEVSDKIKVVSDVDVNHIMAWKNGLFSFKKADLQKIMREVARWYDVNVSFEPNVPPVQFSGKIDRTITLKGFLKILEETRIHYRIEDRRLVITP